MALCLLALAACVIGAFFLLPARLNYHITERYIFSGTDENANLVLGILTPKSGAYQQVDNLTIQWHGNHQIVPFKDVDTIRLTGDYDGDTVEAVVEYDVKLHQGRASWESPTETFHTSPQEGIESDHALFQERAANLTNHLFLSDPYRIYAFTSEYLTYAQIQDDCINSSALKSYEIGSCVCAGYARLMVALCRAAHIPAQMEIGFVYPDPFVKQISSGQSQNPGQAHAWVEYYAFGNWKMADPTLGTGISKLLHFNKNDGRHIAYGEIAQLSQIIKDQKYWAQRQDHFLIGDNQCFRYVASSNSEDVSVTPITEVHKRWDGRWANTILVWISATLILCRFRHKIIP